MSVQFHEKDFTITVPVIMNPVEMWLETTDELINVLKSEDPDLRDGNSRRKVLEVLRNMMPDLETAKKMTLGISLISSVELSI